MSWIPCSKGAAVVVLFVVALAAVGTATAVTVEFSEPEPAEVGDSVEYTATVQEPFRDTPPEWTLQGETELGNATWTVQEIAQGNTETTADYTGSSFTHDLSDQTITQVEVTVSGDVRAIETFDYGDFGDENYTVAELARGSGENANELAVVVGQRYTEESRDARQAIESAIEAADGRTDEIERAISSYNTGNFENAIDIAEDAEAGAQSGQLLLFGAIAVVVIAVAGGGVYYWRERRDKGYKLQ